MKNTLLLSFGDIIPNDEVGFAMFMFFLIGLFFLTYFIAKSRIFEKAGQKGWAAFIPVYSDWVYVKTASLRFWYFLLLSSFRILWILYQYFHISVWNPATVLIALICWRGSLFFCNYNICRRIHNSTGIAILMTIFPFISTMIIGFSKFTWDDSVLVSANGPIGTKKISGNINKNKDLQYCSNCGSKLDTRSKFCGKCGKEI